MGARRLDRVFVLVRLGGWVRRSGFHVTAAQA